MNTVITKTIEMSYFVPWHCTVEKKGFEYTGIYFPWIGKFCYDLGHENMFLQLVAFKR